MVNNVNLKINKNSFLHFANPNNDKIKNSRKYTFWFYSKTFLSEVTTHTISIEITENYNERKHITKTSMINIQNSHIALRMKNDRLSKSRTSKSLSLLDAILHSRNSADTKSGSWDATSVTPHEIRLTPFQFQETTAKPDNIGKTRSKPQPELYWTEACPRGPASFELKQVSRELKWTRAGRSGFERIRVN